jgi:ATP synthase F1 complex assembly factor 1
MVHAATQYPSFVVPLPRPRPGAVEGTGSVGPACEFYFLQWGFHGAPPVPDADGDNPFLAPAEKTAGSNPQTSTVLLTPLEEYKLRGAYATPHLVLTQYTDLARTHGVVLLHGEITPASAKTGGPVETEGNGRFLMEQEEAQMLAMGVQRFYLWGQEGESENEAERLLRLFHEKPGEFNWEELLKYAHLTA